MGEYKPPFTITNEILAYVSSISEKIGRISAISNLESKPHLRRNNRIKSIHSSLKIEANSLSLGQVRDECIFMAPPAQCVPQLMGNPFLDDHVIIRTKLEKPSKIKGLALI